MTNRRAEQMPLGGSIKNLRGPYGGRRAPRVPPTIFDDVSITPPQYGSEKKECEAKEHVWLEIGLSSDYVLLECDTCAAKGEIEASDALERWAQLQAAMAARDKVA